MSVDTYNACVEGYGDHLFDLQILAVQQGYWSGYYGMGSKHPKLPDKIAEDMLRRKERGKNSGTHSNEVDVEQFLATEREFQRKLMEGATNG